MYTRAIQPALWLLIFGETFARMHAIAAPDGLPYLVPTRRAGFVAQSALFVVDLLRHPDHLGTGRGRAHQSSW